jgi:hypothetical protein
MLSVKHRVSDCGAGELVEVGMCEWDDDATNAGNAPHNAIQVLDERAQERKSRLDLWRRDDD